MGITKEEWENPTWVEKGGVRFYYCERKDPTLTQMTQVDADPPILDVEITLFNERMEPRDAMTQFSVVGVGRCMRRQRSRRWPAAPSRTSLSRELCSSLGEISGSVHAQSKLNDIPDQKITKEEGSRREGQTVLPGGV